MLLLGFLLNNLFTKDGTGNISGSTGSTTLTTAQIASHSHTFASAMGMSVNGPGTSTIMGGSSSVSNTGGGQSHDHTLSANFSGSANSVLQPYLVLIYIIKT